MTGVDDPVAPKKQQIDELKKKEKKDVALGFRMWALVYELLGKSFANLLVDL